MRRREHIPNPRIRNQHIHPPDLLPHHLRRCLRVLGAPRDELEDAQLAEVGGGEGVEGGGRGGVARAGEDEDVGARDEGGYEAEACVGWLFG